MYQIVFYIWIFINLLLFIHVLHELVLVYQAFKYKNIDSFGLKEDLPKVTIQLPLYNEKYVVKRLLTAISKLNYPKSKVEIQILDDSTDDTSEIIQAFLKTLTEADFRFEHIQRKERLGFKAGALDYGLKLCTGEYIAIFDADFIPDSEFLLKTIPHFDENNIGLVQTRWQHINEDYSLLTRAQAVMLNTHFAIEQRGRIQANAFINFNGTAGVWRKETIIDSGGWKDDTLTEDLDLSFRSQAKGWKFKYLFDVESPAELPVTFEAYKTQQFRWSKGAAECFRKNITMLWSSKVSLSAKIIGTFHLLNSSIYFLVVGLMLLSPFVFYIKHNNLIDLQESYLSLIGESIVYLLFIIFFVGHLLASRNKQRAVLFFIPSLLTYFSMTMGISIYMVVGIIEGYRGKKTAFIRTPKFGNKEIFKRVNKGYDFKKESGIRLLEFIALVYGLFWFLLGFYQLNLLTTVYGAMLIFGFSLSLFFKQKTFKKINHDEVELVIQ